MNNLIAWAHPAACREDVQDPVERSTTPSLGAASGSHRLAVDSTVFATADRPTGDAAVDTKAGSAMSASPRGVQPRLAETDATQPSKAKSFAGDPSLVVPVIASPAEILRARELRQQLKKKYL